MSDRPERRHEDTPGKDGPRLALPPNRTYHMPGGPYAEDLGEVLVPILAEFRRGSDEDAGVGSSR